MKTMILALLMFFPFLGQAVAADPHHDHSAVPTSPKKAEGKTGTRFEPDAPLRNGMLEIKKLVQDSMPAVHGGTLSDGDAALLAKKVDSQIQGIFTQCKLAPDADQALHDHVLLPIMDGSKVLKTAGGDHQAGVVKMVKALRAYGEHFNHPGWTPVKH